MDFSEFVSFRKMITPTIIQIIFWIGVAGSVLAGLFVMAQGLSTNGGGGIAVLTGLVWIVVGPIVVRIECEILILLFRMHDALVEIRQELVQNRTQGSGAAAGGR